MASETKRGVGQVFVMYALLKCGLREAALLV